jgi:hypothetical protein
MDVRGPLRGKRFPVAAQLGFAWAGGAVQRVREELSPS